MLVEQDHLYLYASREHFEPIDRYDATGSVYLKCLERILPSDWIVRRNSVWYHAAPPNAVIPPQGWKIHISATPANAAPILTTVARMLVPENVSFKFSADTSMLVLQNSKRWTRGGAGKFIAIYPRDEAECGRLLESLYAALVGYRGPYILSDRRYRDSGVLFYRYGGLVRVNRLDVTGRHIPVMRDGEGRYVDDERSPFFRLPPSVRDPFCTEDEQPPAVPDSATLRNGRYTIVSAITFSNTGGVYLCTDNQTNERVIVKEARPLTNVSRRGPDAVWMLKKEHRLLSMLEDLRIAPRAIELFQEWEHFYLVQSLLDGVILRGYMARYSLPLRTRPTAGDVSDYAQRFCKVYARIADIVAALHERHIVFSDLSHYNVMITGDADDVRLIDFEGAYEQDVDIPTLLFTPGFTTQEVIDEGLALPEDDLFALGGLMLAGLMPVNGMMGIDPASGVRFLNDLQVDFGLPSEIIDVACALLAPNRAERPKAAAVAEALRRCQPRQRKPSIHDAGIDPQNCSAALEAIVSYLLASADYTRNDRLFPADPAVFETNPLSVAHGACGVAYALHIITGSVPGEVRDWIQRHELSELTYPPGLYSGLSGIAWVLLELGLHDRAEEALRLVRGHHLLWQSPDVFYGVAGYGMTELRFFLHNGDRSHLEKAAEAGAFLLKSKSEDESGGCWWTAQDSVSYGFAHGCSGIGYFLVALYCATGEERWLDLARRAFDQVATQAIDIADGGVSWRAQRGRPTYTPYWRWGSAGVGAALLRYRHVSGDRRFDEMFRRLTIDCDRKYAIFPGRFFGLSGIADFCLDWAHFIPAESEEALRMARKVLDGTMLFGISRPNGLAFPGETLSRISCDYGTGGAGIAMTLHRLLTGSGTAFMLDELMEARQAASGEPLEATAS